MLSIQLVPVYIWESEGIDLDHDMLKVGIWCYDVAFAIDEINPGPFPLPPSETYDNDSD